MSLCGIKLNRVFAKPLSILPFIDAVKKTQRWYILFLTLKYGKENTPALNSNQPPEAMNKDDKIYIWWHPLEEL